MTAHERGPEAHDGDTEAAGRREPARRREPPAGELRGRPAWGRIDLRHALNVYRLGHDRGWDLADKDRRAREAAARSVSGYSSAGGGVRASEPAAAAGAPDATGGPVPPKGGGTIDAGAPRPGEAGIAAPGSAPGGPREGPGFHREAGAGGRRYGVPIPPQLSFHRGAGTWRDRVRRSPGG